MKQFADNIKPILALTVFILGFGYFYMTTLMGTKSNDQIIIAIVGIMSMAGGYYFGYSSGSAKKDEIIQDNIKNK